MGVRWLRHWSFVVLVVGLAVAVQGLPPTPGVAQPPSPPGSVVVPNTVPGWTGDAVAAALHRFGVVPSGVAAAYPLNHVVDGEVAAAGTPPLNSGFEAAPFEVGSPPGNHGFESPPQPWGVVVNGGFETGDLSGWSPVGTPTVTSGHPGGFAVELGSADKVVSDPFVVPAAGEALLRFDLGFLSSSAAIKVYVLSGTDYGTKTEILYRYCSSGCLGSWETRTFDLGAYAGESVKLEFSRYILGTVAVDGVDVVSVPGWAVSGKVGPADDAGDSVMAFTGSGSLTSDPFIVDTAVQFGTIDVRKDSASASLRIFVLSGPSYGTSTEVLLGYAPAGWDELLFDLSPWAGESVRLKVQWHTGSFSVDDAGIQTVQVPGWTVPASFELVDDGAGGQAIEANLVESDPFVVGSDVQQLTVRHRGTGGTDLLDVFVLSDPGFATSTYLGQLTSTVSWETVKFGVSEFSGETVRLRFDQVVGSTALDDAGLGERLLAGWGIESGFGITVGSDGNGSYWSPLHGLARVTTSPVATGLDPGGLSSSRWYAVSYDIGEAGFTTLTVTWENTSGEWWVVHSDSASSPTGYKTAFFPLGNFVGAEGHFTVKLNGGGRLYSIADNLARQHAAEPFSTDVGLGVDSTTGAVAFSDVDVATQGAMPLTFARYHNTHSDRFGAMGFRWSHSYDTSLTFTAVGDVGVVFGSGREEFFDRDVSGNYTPFDVRVTATLVENAGGSFTYTTKSETVYEFTAAGRLEEIGDRNGNTVTLGYDASDRLTAVTASGGPSITLGYDASGRLSSVSNPGGGSYGYGYDPAGDLVSVTDPEGGVRQYSYDRHLLATVIDEGGQTVVANGYDEVGRLVTQADALANTITVAHNTPGAGVTGVTDPEGGVTSFYYDEWHRVTDAVDPEGSTITYLYDTAGNLASVIDPAFDTWTFGYDAAHNLTSATDPLANPVNIVYDPEHLPTTVTDARGNTTTLAYDASGNPTAVTDPLGHVTGYGYDAAGNVTSVTDPGGNVWGYGYDGAGKRISATDPAGNTWGYGYDPAGLVTSETDPLGNTTTYIRDLLGRVVTRRDPLGAETIYLWSPAGYLVMAQDPLGRQTTWSYDQRGLVVKETDPGGGEILYGYDDNRNVTSYTDQGGRVTGYGYDQAGRMTSQTDPGGNTTTWTYTPAGRLASETDPLGRVTTYGYDDAGRLTQVTFPNSGVRSFGYDPAGNLTSVTDPVGNTTGYGWDARNQLATVTDPLANTWTYTYSPEGDRVTATDPLGRVTGYGYDTRRLPTTTTDPLGQVTTSGYDPAERLASITDPAGRVTGYGYDPSGRLTSITAPDGGVTTYGYDAAGQLTTTTNPVGAVTTRGYDPLGRVTSVTDPLGNAATYGYDPTGLLVSETDPNLHTTTYGYDPAGRRTTITDALGGIVSFGYDPAGQLVTLTDPRGQTRSFGYDLLGNQETRTDPLGRTWTTGYDLAGRPTSTIDPRGITASYGYDAASRPTTTSYPGGVITVGYDAAGRRTTLTDPTGTTTWDYDPAGGIVSVAGPSGTVGYGYDPSGRRDSMTLPEGTVTYGFDPAGRVASITDWNNQTTGYGYDLAGQRTSISRPNGVTTTTGYDPAGQVTAITHNRPAGTLQSFGYGYDPAGNRTSATTAAGTETYGLDALDRLTAVTYPDATTATYTYDASGNRITASTGGQTTSYDYDPAGQLVAIDTQTLSYDQAGNLTDDGATTYTWDWANRLTQASSATATLTLTYNGDGLPQTEDTGSGPQPLLYDTQTPLPVLIDDAAASYLHNGGLTSQITPTATTYPLGDALGSIRGTTDPTGALTASADYTPYGQPRTGSQDVGRFGFTGEPTNPDLGLIHLRARHYQPATGRLLSPDTTQPNAPGSQGFNTYTYTANNPTTWTDPSGHTLQLEDLLTIADPSQLTTLISITTTILASLRTFVAPIGGVATLFYIAAIALTCVLIDGCMDAVMTFIAVLIVAPYLWAQGHFDTGTDPTQPSGQPDTPTEREPQPVDLPLPRPGHSGGGNDPPNGRQIISGQCEPDGVFGSGDEVYRYTGSAEAQTAQNLGRVPAVNRAGQPDPKFYTTAFFDSASAAEAALQIGRLDPSEPTDTPTHRITADAEGADWIYCGANAETIELLTASELKVIRVDPLMP